MFGRGSIIFSVSEIKLSYPNQWVAIAVTETDADGFASAGEVIGHGLDEQFVWSAVKLGDSDGPIYVFFTGSRDAVTAAA